MYGKVRRLVLPPPAQREVTGSPATPEADRVEDIVFYLSRGAELLRQGRPGEAKTSLEAALARRPEDPQGQCLLANVYFRLGHYPRAIELWQRLVVSHPTDVTLRVNLSLAFLKTGQPQLAVAHLEEAVGQGPGHQRAWRYLGLAYWRLERPKDAQHAFLRAGHRPMAERMDAVARCAFPGETVTEVRVRPNSLSESSGLAGEVRDVLRQIAEPAAPVSLDTRTCPGELVAEDAAPGDNSASAGEVRLASPVSCQNSALSLGRSGELLIDSAQNAHLYARLRGMRSLGGGLQSEVVQMPGAGRAGAFLGETDPILRWYGPTSAVIKPPEGQRFVRWDIPQGQNVVASERRVWAFDGTVEYRSESVQSEGDSLRSLRFTGAGAVVVCAREEPIGVRLEAEELRVAPDALVGCVGEIAMRARTGTEPYAALAPPLILWGSGVVYVE